MNHFQYGVICPMHGMVELYEQQYKRQLTRINDVWRCPRCSEPATWDDDSLCMNEESES